MVQNDPTCDHEHGLLCALSGNLHQSRATRLNEWQNGCGTSTPGGTVYLPNGVHRPTTPDGLMIAAMACPFEYLLSFLEASSRLAILHLSPKNPPPGPPEILQTTL